jgi:spore maturation protein CgeB
LKWDAGSLESKQGNVLGDELYAQSLVRALRTLDPELEVDIYAPNRMPSETLDVMIYMNDNVPDPAWSKKRLLYLQNAYGEGADRKLAVLRQNGYDGYAFISNKLMDMHAADSFSGIFLPFSVDLDTFHPYPCDPALAFEVAYVGNDIKGTERSEAYLVPAADFNFGLFGNWQVPRARLRRWKNWGLPRYKYRFEKIARGKIPQAQVPVLYSSSKINLNCTAQDCVDWDVITLRTLEVLACNGFLISDRVPSAERLLGEYIVFTDGHEDLRSKINQYLRDDESRRAMAEAGGQFVRKNFSIQATAQKLLDYLKEL